MTRMRLDSLSKSTTLESNKSLSYKGIVSRETLTYDLHQTPAHHRADPDRAAFSTQTLTAHVGNLLHIEEVCMRFFGGSTEDGLYQPMVLVS